MMYKCERLSVLSGTQTVDVVPEANVQGLKCHTWAVIDSCEGLGAHTWPSELQDRSYPTIAQTRVGRGPGWRKKDHSGGAVVLIPDVA